MMQSRLLRRSDAFAVLFLVSYPFVYFWQVTLAQSVWFTTDVVRLFYPFGVELARALNEGRLPLWTPGMLAGFPLLAEGQVGALYPLNLALYKFLPAQFALSYSILLHLAWAGCGMYACVRSFGLRAPSALLAGFVFSFNGVVFGHLSHPSVIATIAWLPWLVFFEDRLQKARDRNRVLWFLSLTIAFGVQFLCGSVQLAFLNAITCTVFGIAGGLLWNRRENAQTVASSLVLSVVLPALFAGGIAAAQWLPTTELIGYSVRGETSEEFFTSYSLPPAFLSQVVLPYNQGEPSEGTGEYWFYFGMAPLVLAVLAPFLRRDRRTIFCLLFALVALSFALGGQNPAYRLLYHLPVFGFFRVPARYMFVFEFAVALLSATALDELAKAILPGKRAVLLGIFFGVLTLGAIALAYVQPLDFWLGLWQILPLPLLAIAILSVWLVTTRKIASATFLGIMLGLTIFDLASYFPPFLATIDAITPASYVESVPRSVTALGNMHVSERVFADLSVFPSMPALRGSFFPASGLAFGVQSAQAYSSLEYARHDAYFENLSPNALNLLNVRYWMIPLEPRPRTKMVTPPDSVALDISADEVTVTPTETTALQIVSATEQAADLANGTLIAEIVVRFDDGATQVLPLRVGVETADWDYDRKRADNAINHARAPIAHSFPAYWRAFGRAFEGHTFLARYEFASPRKIVGLRARALQSDARLMIESIALETAGQTISLARLAGKNDFALAYMSDTVAAWENRSVLPRAFIVHGAQVLDDDAAFARLHDPAFDPAGQVLLSDGNALRASPSDDRVEISDYQSDRVTVHAVTNQPGYLVLTDSWYPGWNAFVDGQPVPIYRADVLFRAVPLEPGAHAVVFEYHPMSFILGAIVSALSLALVGGIALVPRMWGRRGTV